MKFVGSALANAKLSLFANTSSPPIRFARPIRSCETDHVACHAFASTKSSGESGSNGSTQLPAASLGE